MKIMVNATNLVVGGALQVARTILEHWNGHPGIQELIPLVSPQLARVLPVSTLAHSVSPKPTLPIRGLPTRRRLSELEKTHQPDVVLTVFGPTFWKPKAPHICGFAWPWIDQGNPWPWKVLTPVGRMRQLAKVRYKLAVLKRDGVSAFILETEAMANALGRHFPNHRTFVVRNNCGQSFFVPAGQSSTSADVLPAKTSAEFRIVTLSQYYPHKHLEIIPRVCSLLMKHSPNADYRFYLPLSPQSPHWKRMIQSAERLGVQDRLVTVGEISPADAPGFYTDADLMFLPTLLESFSANYPEAMASGVPILTTDIPFAKDICRDAALYFRPMDAEDAARTIEHIAADSGLRQHLIEAGSARIKDFPSPAERAEAYLGICREVAGARNG